MISNDHIAAASLPNHAPVDSLIENKEVRRRHCGPQISHPTGIGLSFLLHVNKNTFPSKSKEKSKELKASV
jgi:hypothetical protein